MKFSRNYDDATEEQKLDNEMVDEIDEQLSQLKRYDYNIISLLGKERAKEVKKAMINYLLETL